MKFNYQARDSKGSTQVGVVEASSKEAALQILASHGLVVTILEPSKEQPFYTTRIAFFERIALSDLMLFSRQLAILFKAEVSLLESLRTIALQTKNAGLQEKILNIAQEVEAGTSLSQALAKHPEIFSSYYISMVKSGEASGSLSDVLLTLAEHLEREYELKSKIKAAFTYPIFILTIGLAVLVALVVFVMPNLTRILGELGKDLPILTRVAIAIAEALRRFWWLFIGVGCALVFGFLRYIKTPSGKQTFDSLILQIPLLNQFLRMVYVSRFAENLSTLISGGLPIAEALEITQDIVGNDMYKEILGNAKTAVQKGERISDVLKEYPGEFPPIFTQMVLVGEKSGTLDTSLLAVVQFYQKEVARAVESFLSILEPLLIVFLGLFVGGLMAAILLPLYQLGSL